MVFVGQIGGGHQQMYDIGERLPVSAHDVVTQVRQPDRTDQECVQVSLFVDEGLADPRSIGKGFD